MNNSKVIIMAAITGSVYTPSMSPYLPITPQQLADEAVAVCEAGAAIVHTHVRNPETGQPSLDIELFKEIFPNIKKRSNVILCPSTGGRGDLEERTKTIHVLKPEMASLNIGSINFNLLPLMEKIKEWKFDWEKPFLEGSFDRTFQNTFKQVVDAARVFAENETEPDLELHDFGMINSVAYLIEQGALRKPVHIDINIGKIGQAPATIDNLVLFVRTARELIGDFRFTTSCGGKQTINLQAAALAMGGDARIGMEDTLYLGNGQLATSNVELVQEVVKIAEALGREIASPDEARKIIGLKGPDKVSF
ncbi:MAG: 3-keto-5-aminohexanoate cleavage protein [Dehalococcoidales bacterium]|jgi:uncharacterized protein (DUF849 family)|nr:3-keto-5-aminohexanoate cleavage protein [Dehalococcoidales bacterium]MDP7415791.1 3-keto-5-aminohexanoate cleavage protein [Dehalococcoidales bacterium]